MFPDTQWIIIGVYWLAWALGLAVMRRRYVDHLLKQPAEVQRFAFGRTGQTLEGLALIGLMALCVGLLILLVGSSRVGETREVAMFAWLVFSYLVFLSKSGARQQWAIEDLHRGTKDGEREGVS